MSIPPNAHVVLGIAFLGFAVLLAIVNRRKER